MPFIPKSIDIPAESGNSSAGSLGYVGSLNLRVRQDLRGSGFQRPPIAESESSANLCDYEGSPHALGKRLEMQGSQMPLRPPVGCCEQN